MLIIDTGFLVALYIRRDKLHQHALSFLRQNQQALITVAPVIAESCYFLDVKAKIALLNWVACGGVTVVEVPVTAYGDIIQTIEKYADHDIDFTDAAVVWLANTYRQQQILTVDKADFSTFCLKNNQWFQLLEWYP
ncbi:MAG: PIN domain-containing protein [Methylovulum sp.]|nr:PIN domain-containing protein [Methylovulum sp.]